MRRYQHQPLWLSLHFPRLPIDQLRAGDSLCAIAEKQRIAFVSEAALAAGIQPNMRLATAFALQPDIWVVERQAEQEGRALQAISEWCYQFTPGVIPYKNFSVLLDIGGSLPLFKGLTRLRQQIQQGLARQGYHCSEGLAHTREGAWLMSRFRAQQDAPLLPGEINEFSPPEASFWQPLLHSLPLFYLDLEVKQQKQLFNMGLYAVGDLASLPRKELGRRFGKDLLKLLEDLLGEQTAPTADFKPHQPFTGQVDFANGLTRLEDLNQPMEDLLLQLLRFLHQQHCYAQSLEWKFFYFKKADDTVLLNVSPANNNLKSLLSLSKMKFESYVLKAPLESLSLYCGNFTPAEVNSGELFPELSHPSKRWRDYRMLLDKLATRLGEDGLSTLNMNDEHLPEHRQSMPNISAEKTVELQRRSTELPPKAVPTVPVQTGPAQTPLPLWLTQEALPIAAPNDPSGALRLVYGPQRIDSHWWQQRCQRDYFIARHRNGSYCWIFQDLKSRRWFVHGFYA